MRFGFVTCVRLGLACMEEIYQAGGALDLALTLPEEKARAKSGRIYLDEFCQQRRIPLWKFANINEPDAIEAIRRNEIDWLFIIGWSQIARTPVLEAVKKGAIGMHPTLLPRGRGRAAIPWAILKGLSKTGVTMFQLDEGVDSGPILAQEELPLAPDETATRLYERVEQAHRALIRRTWPLLVEDRLQPAPQDERKATVWPGRKPEDGAINPAMSCQQADRMVRATTRPYPGAYLDLEGRRFRIWGGRAFAEGRDMAPLRIDEASGKLMIRLNDGRFEADDWEEEGIPDTGSD